MQFLAHVAIGAAIALLAPWLERTYRARYGSDDGDGETKFLVGAGVWYLIFER
ncbi:hypothetical protein [Aeromicrobium sp. Sec7.5]|uniref:hypothetical protein n=1 Tax=Aeromicrobium sp. Sec7.5 TaxID=3121276 RepID=UPI002FE4CC3F